MKYEISYEKNDIPQAIIIEGPDAATCEAYFKATRSYTAFYGISVPDEVKPGQPVVTVPDDWTNAPDYNMDSWQDLKHTSVAGGQIWTGHDETGHWYLASRPDYYTGDDIDMDYYDTAAERDSAAAAMLAEYNASDDTPEEVPTKEVAPHLHISNGNTKLGHIHNMSLAPGRSCSATACATCLKEGCYACKSYRCYKNTRKAWDDNTELALNNLAAMESGLNAFFDAMTAPRFFRLHVGGDFISTEYAAMWYRIAEKHPATHFLAFTKQWDIVRPVPFYQLSNFTLRLSDWPGTEIPEDLRDHYHIAWLDDDTRPADTFPADCLECPGDCEHCGACWHLDLDTIFHKH